MFSTLKQGSIVYILEKGEKLNLKIGQVANPIQNSQYSFGQPMGLINITVNANGEKLDFSNLPPNQSSTNYNNGTTLVSDNKEAIVVEVENLIQNSQGVINSIDYHQSVVTNGEEILKTLNPRFAKDKERDEEINRINGRINDMDSKLDKVLAALSKVETAK